MSDTIANYEKLGAFYLGREVNPETGKAEGSELLYDSKDLTTHAVCVGMTGSGKTGLCVGLLEEAAIDGIPAIVIDPKGDLGNLMLTFPELRGKDFRPWIDEDAARRKSIEPDAYAQQQADLWRNGLASWGQDGERIRRLKEAAEFAIYTPGSEAGLPVSVLASFAAPSEAVRTDGDLLRERVQTTVTSLLGLMGIKADPLRDREHILLSTIFDKTWRAGESLDLTGLIQAIQDPPIERVGVMELETFFPEKNRFELAMQLNNLLAAPGFATWLNGSPLDVQKLMYTDSGKPRIAIFSIAHLSEDERMFFVSLLLTEVLSWARGRAGTSSLRAILYMDEIFGFLPPSAEPPSKRPMLTLLKQARAYGLGVVLATQNPVDLDYKALSNAGTWFLGRLQTERDKMRVIEGLEGAASGASWDRQEIERTLAGLGKRVFMLHNVHEKRPVLFHTRWVMSYLRGPLTREQIRRLKTEHPSEPTASSAAAGAPAAPAPIPAAAGGPGAPTPPALPPSIPQSYLPVRGAVPDTVLYHPGLVGLGRVQFVNSKTKRTLHSEEVSLLLPLGEESRRVDWESADAADLVVEDLERAAVQGARFGGLASSAGKRTSHTTWRKEFSDMLYRSKRLELLKSPSLGLLSEPGEAEGEFRVRLADLGRERRDAASDKLRAKYARRVDRLEERIRRAHQKIERETEQASGKKMETMLSLGATVLGALFSRGRSKVGTIGRATSTARRAGRIAKEKQDVRRAQEDLAELQHDLEALNRELEDELDELDERLDPRTEKLETISVRPRRRDVEVRHVGLTWQPFGVAKDGALTPLWE